MLLTNGKFHHIQLEKGEVGGYVLLPGDPFRTDVIARYLDDAKLVAHNREHKTYTGKLLGEKVSVTSTGMGCPSTAIAVEELIACGAHTIIRVGTAGRVNEASQDVAMLGGIITGAVRDEGTTRQYVPIEYPAISNRHVVAALSEAAQDLGLYYGEGISYTKDSFYSLVMPEEVPMSQEAIRKGEIWTKANVLLTEMESAALLVISAIRGCRAGGIMAFADSNDPALAIDQAVRVACKAIENLIELDRDRSDTNVLNEGNRFG